MDDLDLWIYLDGPEPEHLRPALAALRASVRPTPEEREQAARRFFAALEAKLEAERGWRPGVEVGANDVTSEPAPARAPAHLATTQAMGPVADPWPFTPPEQLPPQKRASKTLQTPEERTKMGGTFPLGDDSMRRAMPALPFAGHAVGTVVDFPQMPVERYAWLCVELSLWPEWEKEILCKYYVPSKASREALDAHWRTILAAQPEARAKFESDSATYWEWLRTQR